MPKSGSENAARCAAFAGMKGCALSFYYRGARAFGVDVDPAASPFSNEQMLCIERERYQALPAVFTGWGRCTRR